MDEAKEADRSPACKCRANATAGATGWLLCGIAAILLGCSGSDVGCSELCAKEVQCRQDLGVMVPDEQACVDTCEALAADDPAYADAVEERAECIQEASCEEVVFGFGCAPDGT